MKQRNLFNEREEALIKEIELYRPLEEERQRVVTEYSRYTVSELRRWIEWLYPLVKGRVVVGEGAGTFVADAVANMHAKPTSAPKSHLLDFLAIFLGDIRNFGIYLQSLPADDLVLWRHLMANHRISHSELKKMMGRDYITTSKESYNWRDSLSISPSLGLFDVKAGEPTYYDRDTYQRISEYYISLPWKLRSWLVPLFYGKEEWSLNSLPELPDEAKGLQCFSAESFIFVELSVLDSLGRQGDLAVDAKWKLSAVAIKKIAAKMSMTEIFPSDANRYVAAMRANLVLPAFAFYWMKKKRDIAHPEKELKDIFGTMLLNYPTILMPILLSFTAGMRSAEFMGAPGLARLNLILSLLRAEGCRGWLSVDQLLLNSQYRGVDINPFYEYSYAKMELKEKLSGDVIYEDGWSNDVAIPFVKAFFFLLASFGLLEIACDKDTELYPSPFYTLKYFRPTALGAYVLDFTETYEKPKTKEEGPFFDLDSNNLIVRSLSDNNPYESLLQDIAEPIGARRYKVTHASLLNNCATYMDVSNRVEFFKRFISSDLPEVWSAFFASLMKRCSPLKGISPDMYLLYQLDSNNDELLKLISTDPLIRKYTVRAEGHMLLVRKDAYKQVITRLKSFGYLL